MNRDGGVVGAGEGLCVDGLVTVRLATAWSLPCICDLTDFRLLPARWWVGLGGNDPFGFTGFEWSSVCERRRATSERAKNQIHRV